LYLYGPCDPLPFDIEPAAAAFNGSAFLIAVDGALGWLMHPDGWFMDPYPAKSLSRTNPPKTPSSLPTA